MVGPAVLLFGLFFAGFGRGETVCNAFTEGAAACLANKQCICRFDPGGALPARPAGYRWSCGVLRPACELPPPSLPVAPMPQLPYAPSYGAPHPMQSGEWPAR